MPDMHIEHRADDAKTELEAHQKAVSEANERFARVFLQMLGEAHAAREARTINGAWRGREFSGREDWERLQRGEDWS